MRAAIGRTVHVLGIYANGADVHPALITRTWSDRDTKDGPVPINVTVFPDMQQPQYFQSVWLHETRAQAERDPSQVRAFLPPTL